MEKEIVKNLISAIALIISVISLIRTHITSQRQRELQIAGYVSSYLRDFRQWADEVIRKMTEAAFLCELNPVKMKDNEFFRQRHDLRTQFSALLDRGRFFLPNEHYESLGTSKPSAYRGLRQEALNKLAEATELLNKVDYTDSSKNAPYRHEFVKLKKEFVSGLQTDLEVRRGAEIVKQLTYELYRIRPVQKRIFF